MSTRPTLIVEDDPFPRMLRVYLDPGVEPERVEALRHFLAHDLPDLDGWMTKLRAMAGPLYPATVKFAADQATLHALLPEATVLITESLAVGEKELALAPGLKVVQKYGTRLHDIDLAACKARGITVRTLRRRANISCAEHALMLMLALTKKLHRTHGRISFDQLRQAGFNPGTFDTRYTPNSGWARIEGLSVLYGATLGIIGFGEIARELAIRAHAFGMTLLVHQRTPLTAEEQHKWHVTQVPMNDLLEQSDWVCVQVPSGHATRDLISTEQFARMKPGAKLINVSRAHNVNRDALLAALRSGRLGGFGLDPLYEEPGDANDELLKFDNTILTPHIAAMPRFNALSDFEELVTGIGAELW